MNNPGILVITDYSISFKKVLMKQVNLIKLNKILMIIAVLTMIPCLQAVSKNFQNLLKILIKFW